MSPSTKVFYRRNLHNKRYKWIYSAFNYCDYNKCVIKINITNTEFKTASKSHLIKPACFLYQMFSWHINDETDFSADFHRSKQNRNKEATCSRIHDSLNSTQRHLVSLSIMATQNATPVRIWHQIYIWIFQIRPEFKYTLSNRPDA